MIFRDIQAIIAQNNSGELNEKLSSTINESLVFDINMKDDISPFHTMLTWACYMQSIECVKVLLSKKADVNIHIKDDDTALKLACESSSFELVELLLLNNAFIDDFILAAFKLLLQRLEFIWPVPQALRNIFICACKHNSVELVQMLLEYGLDPFAAINYDREDAFAIAINADSLDVVKLITQWVGTGRFHVNNLPDKYILLACKYSSLSVMRYFLESGIKVASIEDLVPLAVRFDDVDMLKLFIEYGADVNCKSKYGTLLFIACGGRFYCAGAVKVLLEAGADVHHRNYENKTYLQAAIERYHVHLMRLLFAHGADLTDTTHGRAVILYTILAVLKGRVKGRHVDACLALLVEVGADVDTLDPRTGQTSLMIAAKANRADLVGILLEYGADMTVIDRSGKSVWDMLGDRDKYAEVLRLCEQSVKPLLK